MYMGRSVGNSIQKIINFANCISFKWQVDKKASLHVQFPTWVPVGSRYSTTVPTVIPHFLSN